MLLLLIIYYFFILKLQNTSFLWGGSNAINFVYHQITLTHLLIYFLNLMLKFKIQTVDLFSFYDICMLIILHAHFILNHMITNKYIKINQYS
jgi:hypothetical protein